MQLLPLIAYTLPPLPRTAYSTSYGVHLGAIQADQPPCIAVLPLPLLRPQGSELAAVFLCLRIVSLKLPYVDLYGDSEAAYPSKIRSKRQQCGCWFCHLFLWLVSETGLWPSYRKFRPVGKNNAVRHGRPCFWHAVGSIRQLPPC